MKANELCKSLINVKYVKLNEFDVVIMFVYIKRANLKSYYTKS